MALTSAIDVAIQIKISGWGILRAREEINLVISNEHMDNIIRIIKSLENLGRLTDEVIETVKRWIFWIFNVSKYVGWKSCNDSWKRI